MFQSFSNTSRLHLCRTLPDFNWHARVARSLSDSWASCYFLTMQSKINQFLPCDAMLAQYAMDPTFVLLSYALIIQNPLVSAIHYTRDLWMKLAITWHVTT